MLRNPAYELQHPLPPFVAIDFETANRRPSSACAIGVVRTDGNAITERRYHLIRQETRSWVFSRLHGITSEHVQHQLRFGEVWRDVESLFAGCAFVVSHNAKFDARVLRACCAKAGVRAPRLPYLCSLVIARDFLRIRPSDLVNVCRELSIALHHHHALSDAEAAARIVVAAASAGWRWRTSRGRRGMSHQ
ncbi:MAG: exonuclease domain-containing protein [Candidatus Binatia bacterium]